jgi:hypothetical protein
VRRCPRSGWIVGGGARRERGKKALRPFPPPSSPKERTHARDPDRPSTTSHPAEEDGRRHRLHRGRASS